MRVISELHRRLEESGLEPLVDTPDVVNSHTIRRTYKAPGPNSQGEVVVVHQGDYTAEVDWQAAPEVSWNSKTRRVVVQPGTEAGFIGDISEVHASGKQRVLVLAAGLDLRKVSAEGHGNVLVRTDAAPRVSALGNGKVKVRAGR